MTVVGSAEIVARAITTGFTAELEQGTRPAFTAMTAQAEAAGVASGEAMATGIGSTAAANEKAASRITAVTRKAFMGIGLAAAATLVEGVHLAEGMQKVDASIAGVTHTSVKAATAIGDAMLGTAGKSTFSGAAMAEAYAGVAGQLEAVHGKALNAKQALEVMEAATALAEAKSIDLAGATKTVTATLQAFGLGIEHAATVSDVLFAASNATGQTVDQLGTQLGKLHSKLGDSAGSLTQMAGLLVDMTKHGVSGRAAIAGLTTGINAVQKASAQDGLRKLGVDAFDAHGKFRGMGSVIAQLEPRFAKMSDAQKTAAATTIFGASAAKQMAAVIDAGSGAYARATREVGRHGQAESAAEKQAKTLHGMTQTLKATFQDLATQAGEKLIPMLTSLGKETLAVVGFFRQHKTVTALLTTTLVALGAAFTVVKVAAGFSALVQGLATAFWALDAAMDANPIGLVVVALAALAAGIIYAYKHSEKFRAVVDAVFKALKGAVTTAIDFVSEHWKTIIEIMLGPFGLVLAGVLKFRKQIVGAFKATVNAVSDAWDALKKLPGTIIGFFEDLPDKMLELGKNIVQGIVNGILHAPGKIADALKGVVGDAVDGVKGLLGIGSPSKLMHQYGQWTTEGFQMGVKDAARTSVATPLGTVTYTMAAGGYTARSAASGTYSKSDLEALWIRAGGSARMANVAASIALAESGGRARATNVNRDGSVDRGLWQINSVHGSQSTTDPLANARAAVAISKAGRDFSAWVAYTTGAYRKFLEQAASPSKASPKSTPRTAEDITAWARKAIGHFAESTGANRGPELDKLQAEFHTRAAAWCAEFATTAAMMGGANKAVRTASVMTIKQWAEAGTHGYEQGLKRTGQAGDVVMLHGSEGPFSHTGFVTSVNRARGTFTTAEGNTNGPHQGAVRYVTHRMSDSEGFARPTYRSSSGGSAGGLAGAAGGAVMDPATQRRVAEATIAAERHALDTKIRNDKTALDRRVRVEELAVAHGTSEERAAVAKQVAEQRATLHASIIMQRAALATQIANQRAALADATRAAKVEAAKQTRDAKAGGSQLNTLLKAIHSGSLGDLNTALATVHVQGLSKTVAGLRSEHSKALSKLADELVKVHREAVRLQHDEQKAADDKARGEATAAAAAARADAAAAAQSAAADEDQRAASVIAAASKIASDMSAAAAQAIQDETKVTLDRQAEVGKTGAELLAAQAQTALDVLVQSWDAQVAAAQLALDRDANASQAQQAQDAANLALVQGNAQIAQAQAQANLDLASAAASAATSTPVGGPGLPATSTQPIFHITVNGSGATAVDIVSEITWALKTGAIALPATVPTA